MKLSALLVALGAVAFTAAAPAVPAVVATYDGMPGPIVYDFGECIPFTANGMPINYAQFNYLSKCYLYTDNACRNQATPVPVVVPPGVNYPNAGDAGNLVGESAMCWEEE